MYVVLSKNAEGKYSAVSKNILEFMLIPECDSDSEFMDAVIAGKYTDLEVSPVTGTELHLTDVYKKHPNDKHSNIVLNKNADGSNSYTLLWSINKPFKVDDFTLVLPDTGHSESSNVTSVSTYNWNKYKFKQVYNSTIILSNIEKEFIPGSYDEVDKLYLNLAIENHIEGSNSCCIGVSSSRKMSVTGLSNDLSHGINGLLIELLYSKFDINDLDKIYMSTPPTLSEVDIILNLKVSKIFYSDMYGINSLAINTLTEHGVDLIKI